MKTITQASEFMRFVPKAQTKFVNEVLGGEEGEYFSKIISSLGQRIIDMPVTYEQDGKGDKAIAYLHYFANGCDWCITEKDMDGGIQQAFGLAKINSHEPELGYISIAELVEISAMEMDFYWTPKTLREVKA